MMFCVCVCGGHALFKSFIEKHGVRPLICVKEGGEEMEAEVFHSMSVLTDKTRRPFSCQMTFGL